MMTYRQIRDEPDTDGDDNLISSFFDFNEDDLGLDID